MMMMMIIIIIIIIITIIIIIIIIIIHLLLLLLLLNYYYYYYYLYIYLLLSLWLWQSNSVLILIHHFNSNFDCNICCFSRTLELLSKPFKWYSLFFFYFVVSTCICSSFLRNCVLRYTSLPSMDPSEIISLHPSSIINHPSIINDPKQKNQYCFHAVK